MLLERTENCPWRVEEDVGGELFLVFVFAYCSSVNSDDVPNSLRNWQIFKFIGEENQRSMVDKPTISIADAAWGICDFHRANVFIRFETLVRELSIKDHGIEMHFVGSRLARTQVRVVVHCSWFNFLSHLLLLFQGVGRCGNLGSCLFHNLSQKFVFWKLIWNWRENIQSSTDWGFGVLGFWGFGSCSNFLLFPCN